MRRALLTSTVLWPAYLFSSAALAQSAQPPIANAGVDRTITDTNGLAGERVTLQGSGTSVNVGGSNTLDFEWYISSEEKLADGATPTVDLPDGVNQLTLVVTDNCCSSSSSLTTTSMVTITVRAPVQVQAPTANAGPDHTVPDSDGAPGESVTLEGSGSSRNTSSSSSLSFVWTAGGQQVATGARPTLRLADGVNNLTLTVTDNCCSSSGSLVTTDSVQITVASPNNAPVANAGADRSIADTDERPGERVTLDASASSDADGTITSYTWMQGDTTLGTGRVLTNVALPDGQNAITLVVTDNSNNTSSDTVLISVAEPLPRAKLSDVALTTSQKAMARTLDDLCSRLVPSVPVITLQEVPVAELGGVQRALPIVAGSLADTDDLAERCVGILSDRNASNQRKALDELSAQ